MHRAIVMHQYLKNIVLGDVIEVVEFFEHESWGSCVTILFRKDDTETPFLMAVPTHKILIEKEN